MSAAPLITIFVRHKPKCKHAGEEFSKKCTCMKHLRWTQNGKQFRKQTGARSWQEAEEVKRDLEDQLSGRVVAPKPVGPRTVEEAVTLFMQDKQTQGISHAVITGYRLELGRFRTYCEAQGVYVIAGVTRELLTGFCATWAETYKSSYTRGKVRERLSGFLTYCFEAQWIDRKPPLPKINVDEPPTMPLTMEEYDRLLAAIPAVFCNRPDKLGRVRTGEKTAARVRSLIQLMRWSGLAIQDASTLKRAEIIHDETRGLYRVVTKREKTGTHVSVPLPPAVALEVLAVPNDNAEYIFWDPSKDNPNGRYFASHFGQHYVSRLFEAAGIPKVCTMVSHRLRDTFAVDLLIKGVALEEVSKLLGHTSIRTTERHYSAWIKGRQDKLDDSVVGTWGAGYDALIHRAV